MRDKRVREATHIPARDFAVGKERCIEIGDVHLSNFVFNADAFFVPVFPAIDIGDEKDRLFRPLNLIARDFRKLLSMRYEKRRNAEIFSQGFCSPSLIIARRMLWYFTS